MSAARSRGAPCCGMSMAAPWSTPPVSGIADTPDGGLRRGGWILDRDADHRAVFGPAPVVVADVRKTQELLENEPGMRGPFADATVGDDWLGTGHAPGAVQLAELVRALERAVVVGGLSPRNV